MLKQKDFKIFFDGFQEIKKQNQKILSSLKYLKHWITARNTKTSFLKYKNVNVLKMEGHVKSIQ